MSFPSLKTIPQFHRAIDAEKFAPGLRMYNASLVQFEGELVLAYRLDDAQGFSSVYVQRVKKNLAPMAGKPLPREGKVEHEDPRLFVAGGKLYLAFIELNGRHRDGVFTQELAELGPDLSIVRRIPLTYGRNGVKSEKNWIFFDAGQGRIGFVYSLKPHRVAIVSAETGAVLEEHETAGIGGWNFGTLSGGTPAIKYGPGTFVHFFHSYIPHHRRQRIYSLTAATFADSAPYHCTGVSEKPLAWASDLDRSIVNPRRPGWNPLCVFPSGIVDQDEGWLVSCGVNDSSVVVLKFGASELKLVEPKVAQDPIAAEQLGPVYEPMQRKVYQSQADRRRARRAPRRIIEMPDLTGKLE